MQVVFADSAYWLRSPGQDAARASIVWINGNVNADNVVTRADIGARPDLPYCPKLSPVLDGLRKGKGICSPFGLKLYSKAGKIHIGGRGNANAFYSFGVLSQMYGRTLRPSPFIKIKVKMLSQKNKKPIDDYCIF